MLRLTTLLLLPLSVQAIVKCISIFGLETPHRNWMCDWKHPVDYYIWKLKDMGFNSLRFPFCYQYVIENDFTALDFGIQKAYEANMSVILDFHRTWNDRQQYSPFSDGVTVEQFHNAWVTVLSRYRLYPNVVAMNAYNEYQSNDVETVKNYTINLFNHVESIFPKRFKYYATGHTWAGNLSGMSLEHLPYADRIFYSTHKYPWSGTADEKDWEFSFGNVGLPLEKICVGEFGFFQNQPQQLDWMNRFIDYLKKKGIRNTCYWAQSQSADTENIWANDCEYINWPNYLVLRRLWETERLRKG